MTCDALSADQKRPWPFVVLGRFLLLRRKIGDTSDTAQPTKAKPMRDGSELAGLTAAETRHSLQMQMLLTRREILCKTAAKMRDQRRCREASISESAARQVVNDILAGGEP